MKVTASVPDNLWAAAHPKGERPSHTVQRGLRLLVQELDRAKVPFAQAPPDVDLDALKDGRERLRTEATERRRQGYEWGIRVASAMSWDNLEALLDSASEIPHDRALVAILGEVAEFGDEAPHYPYF